MTRRHRHKQRLTAKQAIALIPGGAVPVIRMERGDIDIEPAVVSDKTDAVLVMRQVVSTLVRKLIKQGAITAVEAEAAGLLRFDHDAAYARSRSILASVQVDGGKNDCSAMDRVLQSADRFRQAMRALCPELRRIASLGIVDADVSATATYQTLGRTMLPQGNAPEQTGAGKAALVLTCRELAVFYGLRRPG